MSKYVKNINPDKYDNESCNVVEYVGDGWVSIGRGETYQQANEAAFNNLAAAGCPQEIIETIAGKREAAENKSAYSQMCRAERDAHDNL